MATNYYQGNTSPWTSNINVSAIGVAAVQGALTSGASAGAKIALKMGAAIVNNTVEIKYGDEKGEGGLNVKLETNPANVVKNATIDLVADAVSSKAASSARSVAKKTASVVGATNSTVSTAVKETIKASGGQVNRATNNQVKKAVKSAGTAAKDAAAKGAETLVKTTTDKPKGDVKQNSNFGQ